MNTIIINKNANPKRLFSLKPLSVLYSSVLFLHLGLVSNTYANPEGGNVVGGSGRIHTHGNTTAIHQQSQNMAIDWQSYNVQQNERVQYIQPNSRSISLNRILCNNASTIRGRIDANGQVILVNPNGIFFSPTATINVGGIMASGLDIKPSDFMNGNYIFNEVAGTDGFVINSGIINAATGGNVTLLGKQVTNNGMITAKLGTVNLAAGKQAVVTFDNAGLLGVKITKEVLQNELGIDPAVLNSGSINAEGGRILLTASVSQDIFSSAVNTGGMVDATSAVVNADGSFTLGNGADVVNAGTLDVSVADADATAGEIVVIGENVTNSGVIKADSEIGSGGNIELHATNATLLTGNSLTSAQSIMSGRGGAIKVLGNKVGLFDSAQVNASGSNGGGKVLIGGDKTGKNIAIRNAEFIYLGEKTNVKADATDNGNGGKLITFASNTAQIYGNLSARGGRINGNGGFIETSGLIGFDIANAPDVSAVNGVGGEWLIDPFNISIVATSSSDSSFSTSPPDANDFKDAGGLVTSSGDSATIKVKTITDALKNGNVTITTGDGTTTQLGDITFDTAFAYTDNSNTTLTLNAANDIITIGNDIITTDGRLNLIFNADYSSTGVGDGVGSVIISGAQIRTRDGGFTATGVDFTLTETAVGRNINTGSGKVNINMDGTVIVNGAITTNDGSVDITGNTFTSDTKGIITTTNFIGGDPSGTVKITANGTATTASLITIGGDIITRDAAITLAANQAGFTSAGIVTVNGDIQTRGRNVTVSASSGFTNTGTINTSSAGGGNVSIASTGAVKINGAVTTNNGFVNITDSTSYESNVAGTITTTDGSGADSAGDVSITSSGLVTSGGKVLTNGGFVRFETTGVTAATGAVAINESIQTGGGSITSIGANFTNSGVGTLSSGSGNINITANGTTVVDGTVSIGAAITTSNGGNVNIKKSAEYVSTAGINTSGGSNGSVSIISDGKITSGDLVNAGNGSVSFTNNIGAGTADIILNGNVTTSSTLDVATNGAITATNAPLQVGSTASFISGGTGAVTLNNNANNFGGNVSITNTVGDVVVHDADAIQFATTQIGLGAFTVNAGLGGGTGGISQTGNITQATGAGAVSLNGGNGAIALARSGNSFTGMVALNNSGANDVSLRTRNGLQLTTSNVGSGTLTLQAATGITQTGGTITQATGAGAVTLNGGTGAITLADPNNEFTGNVGLTTTSNASLSDTNGIALGSSTVGGDLVLSAGGAGNTNAGAISFTNANVGGALTATAGSASDITASITGSGITVANTATFNVDGGRSISLLNTNNNFNGLSFNAKAATGTRLKDVRVANSSGLDLQTLDLTGDLEVTAGGTITNTTGSMRVAGLTTLNARSGTTNFDITLATGANNFNNVQVLNGKDFTITDEDGMNIAGINLTGNLNITAKGDVTQTAAIDMAAGTTATVDAGVGQINLGTQANDFGIVNLTSASAVTINDTLNGNGITLDNVNVTGSGLTVTSTGAINDTGNAITVSGLASFTTAGAVNLASVSHNFSRLSANAVSLNIDNANSLRLGTSNLTGSGTTLRVLTNGSLSQSGSITSNGSTVINTGANGITLGDGTNDFVGTVSLTNTAGNVVIRDTNSIDFATTNLGNGSFTVNAGVGGATGGITQTSGVITQAASAGDVILSSGNGNINLNNTSNELTGSVALTTTGTASAILSDTSSIVLGTTNVAGSLTLSAGGAGNSNTGGITLNKTTIGGNLTATAGTASDIIQNESVGNELTFTNAASLATFNVNAGRSISLGNVDNDFNGLSFNANTPGQLKDITIADINALDLQTLDLSGDLKVTAGGNIDNTAGSLQVDGLTTLQSGGDVNLVSGTNDFNQVLITSANNVTIADANTLTIGDSLGTKSTINGDLTLNTNGNIEQTAALTMNAGTTARFNAGSGDINLGAQGSNDFKNVVLNTTGSVSLSDANSIVIGDAANTVSNIGGDFSLKTNGDITQTAAITMSVNSVASFDAGNGQINFGTLGNDFDQLKLTSTRAVNINDINGGLTLGTSNITGAGTLTINTTGNINNYAGTAPSDNGNVRVDGLTTINAGTNSITLATGSHSFNDIIFTGSNVAITNSKGINIGNQTGGASTSTASGSLTLNTNGDITNVNSTSVNVANAATFSAGRGDVLLNNVTLQGNVNATANNSITISNSQDLSIGSARANTEVDLSAVGRIDSNGGAIQTARLVLSADTGIAVTTQTSKLNAVNTAGAISVNNTGAITLEQLKTVGNITLTNDADINFQSGSVDADYDVGIIDMTTDTGSFLGLGAPDNNNPDITGFSGTFEARLGSFGSAVRPLVISIKDEILINTRQSISPRYVPRPPRIVNDLSDIKFDFLDASNAIAGEQLISLEELEDIDPAIFSDVRNYTYGQIAIRLPRDQLFEDELEVIDAQNK